MEAKVRADACVSRSFLDRSCLIAAFRFAQDIVLEIRAARLCLHQQKDIQ